MSLAAFREALLSDPPVASHLIHGLANKIFKDYWQKGNVPAAIILLRLLGNANNNILQGATDLPEIALIHKETVIFNYNIGKCLILQGNYKLARHHLDYALLITPPNLNLKIINSILNLLIPLHLIEGKLPNLKFLNVANSNSKIKTLLMAFNNCDPVSYCHILNNLKNELILSHVYSVYLLAIPMIKLRLIYKLTPKDSHLVSLSHYPNHYETVIADLISRGLIKGYLSHGKQMLVLSKSEPFPTIGDSL
ncbi:hypothetical protein DAMA08_015660 [Martiniozyma asiatica (nom. inval.)]|nr:hypothetical protein DAMA08_015660 [Martiniozyma asiatica]